MPKKEKFNILESLSNSSNSSLSSINSSTIIPLVSWKDQRERITEGHVKRDYLMRLFEKKKLKDKSLSKKVKTPFDRKINRTCWPIELNKVSKIQKKPKEKRKQKPTRKSLKKKRFSTPSLHLVPDNSDATLLEDSDFHEISIKRNHNNHFLYEPVTPQMLIDVLQDPEHLKSGATLDMIIAKLRALKLDLNPSLEMLQEEVLKKLECAIKLRLVVENNGYYIIPDTFRLSKIPRAKVDAFWDMWYRKIAKCSNENCENYVCFHCCFDRC